MYYIALVAVLAVFSVDARSVTVGQGEGCCLPQQMEAFETMALSETVQGARKRIMGNIWLAMDTNLKKTFSNITLIDDGKLSGMFVLQDFQSQTQYLVKGGQCMKSALDPWVPKCIPQGAIFRGSSYFGNPSGPNSLPLNTYEIQEKNITGYLSVTQEQECLPVVEFAYGTSDTPSGPVPLEITLGFLNITRSVHDPHIFDVPSICQGSHVPVIPKPHTMPGSVLLR